MCSVEEGSSELVESTTDPPLVPVQDKSTLDRTTTDITSTVSSSSRKHRQICKYIASKKSCPYGDRCRFWHPQPTPTKQRKEEPICQHYLSGHCRYEGRCRYRHPDTNATNTSSSGEPDKNDESSLLNVSSFPSLSTKGAPYKEERHATPEQRVRDNGSSTGRGRRGRGQEGGPPVIQLEAFFKRSMNITPRPAVSRPSRKGNSSLSALRTTEMEQLELRYPSHTIKEKSMERTVYNIQFYPTDPDWVSTSIYSVHTVIT